jgi:hypothetical protein
VQIADEELTDVSMNVPAGQFVQTAEELWPVKDE